ncbi:MAG: phenylalanine--tRNA ligase subunit alpha [Bacilli bacterium]|jgi:phenylalanyl-tRNA synthetase alpha chain|nr:phenylalanine--tRNA ligase subunit alpha [Bacilli bacterium]MDD3348899.1 phenylalanine--tRNA ligase subunit alpha [Bacilli bacterium]MDD4056932.1 phenylalanine--tRNA ligase subunit alpha [Bacilli bacterium]
MISKLIAISAEAKVKISTAKTLPELYEAKSLYLGKKSPIQEIFSKMKDFTIEMKKEVGQKINEFKNMIEEEVVKRQEELSSLQIAKKLEAEAIDVTLPGKQIKRGNLHVLTKTITELEDIFIAMGYKIVEGPEVEEDLYNFEMLNLPKGHPAREMQDSFYINPNLLLRTHTSPVQARTMLVAKGKPIKIVCPGKVYRRDDDDATHSHQFMQLEGLVVGKDITMSDLKGTLTEVFSTFFGNGQRVRFRPSYFPFTEPSVEVDVSCFKCKGVGCSFCKGSGWIEILGAGMVHPHVLDMAGYDSTQYQGFAFGIGIERVTMFKYGIDDIRNFYINDPRFLKQF